MARTVTVDVEGWKLIITSGVGVFKINKAEYFEDTGHLVVWVTEKSGGETSHCFSLELPDGGGAAKLAVNTVEQWEFVPKEHTTLSPVR